MDLLHLILFLPLIVLVFVRTDTLLTYFQQEEYSVSRFATAIRAMRLYDVIGTAGLVLILLPAIWLDYDVLALIGAGLLLLAVAYRESRYRFKKPAVRTFRYRRLANIALGLGVLLALPVLFVPLFAIITLQAIPLLIAFANVLLQRPQEALNERYVDEARQKLKSFGGVRIGVTGSFGKTTVKHILGQVLSFEHRPFYSRGSINTVLGLTRHIRQRLQPAHTHFIAEMGAYQVGSIRRLCELVEPEIGIVTAVGAAHLERFGSIEETAKAKAELAEWVCERGTLLVTTEAVAQLEPFRTLLAQHRNKFLLVGPSHAADIQIVASDVTAEGRKLTLRFTHDSRSLDIVTPYLASFNDTNIALVVAVLSRITPTALDYLPTLLAELEQVPHRLERKERVNAPLLLDDAYNSNEIGFAEALRTLRDIASIRRGKAILVTPGIVELGPRHDDVHRELGATAAKLCDLVYVVNPDRIPTFVEGLGSGGAGDVEVKTVKRFQDAADDIEKHHNDVKNVVLYENDLPDVVERKRLL